MSKSYALLSTILADRRVDDAEVPVIREHLYEDGSLDLDDVEMLVKLYCEAVDRGPAFEDLFFEVLEDVVLADGEIRPAEQFYLLKMLYSDRRITRRERDFLLRLRQAVKRSTPEFDALCETALSAHPTNWDVGGR